ncbi:hypothetical protein LTR53_005871 [Teratosphaeriaceae sp. CCFEE 6253]|nr:hypothetical protein LTR53_005871 [Teratosphaeriaceae sp. CCFEE 6253]
MERYTAPLSVWSIRANGLDDTPSFGQQDGIGLDGLGRLESNVTFPRYHSPTLLAARVRPFGQISYDAILRPRLAASSTSTLEERPPVVRQTPISESLPQYTTHRSNTVTHSADRPATRMEDMNDQTWHRTNDRGAFVVSTRPDFLDHDFINTAFGTDDMFWAATLPPDQLAKALAQSVTVGLYLASHPAPPSADENSAAPPPPPQRETLQQIGLARLVTDHVTFAYLSDVYILPSHRGQALFPWLIACVKELLRMHPALRRATLLTGSEGLTRFYARALGVWDMREEPKVTFMSRKAFSEEAP